MLQTKFLVPQRGSDLLPRPHLLERLSHALLEKSPPSLHLVISSRTDPPLGLARQYQQLQQALRAEFNIDPSSQTQELYRRLMAEANLNQG